MTIVVLLFLAVIWAAVLVPPLLRARAEGRPADSIGNFRRQLHVLQRTGPGLSVPPANSLGSFLSSPRGMSPASGLYAMGRPALSPEKARRARTLKRRRDVFYALLAAMGGSLVLGMVPGLRVLWGLHLLLDVLFAGYVGMLVHMRNQAAEREMKLRFIPGAHGAPEPALLLRRSAN